MCAGKANPSQNSELTELRSETTALRTQNQTMEKLLQESINTVRPPPN